MINRHPAITFNVITSLKIIADNMIVSTKLNLSIATTFETSPICNALK